jgi:hypothetical protein
MPEGNLFFYSLATQNHLWTRLVTHQAMEMYGRLYVW